MYFKRSAVPRNIFKNVFYACYGGQEITEEVQEFIQQTYTSGKYSSLKLDTKSGTEWGFEKPDVIFLASEASCKILRLLHINRLKFLSTDQYVRPEFF